MAVVLPHIDCTSCGHRHNFCLPVGDLELGRDYAYVCPETRERALLRPQSPPGLYRYPPQGAVQLSPDAPAEDGVPIDEVRRRHK